APSLTDSALYVIDMGLSPTFKLPEPQPFATVNTPDADEDGPAFAADNLYFTRTPKGGPSRLFTAGTAAGIGAPTSVADLGTPADASERDAFPLPDGRLLFVSNRDGGVAKIWVKLPGGTTVTRATKALDTAAEHWPFVDEAGTLWLSFHGGSDPA